VQHGRRQLGIVRAMEPPSNLPEPSLQNRILFASLGYGAGLLGVLAWGWISGAVFLVFGGGLGDDPGEPVLPFMVTWASVFAGPAALMLLTMYFIDSVRAGEAPWSWMRRIAGAAAAVCGVAWLWLWLGA
jgi:hypothetical protein